MAESLPLPDQALPSQALSSHSMRLIPRSHALTGLSDEQWSLLAPMVEACRPSRRTDHHDLRRTVEAILWRCRRGITWRSLPPRFGPWWMAAQTCIRWRRLGVWERLAGMERPPDGSLDEVLALLATLAPPRRPQGERPGLPSSRPGRATLATADRPG